MKKRGLIFVLCLLVSLLLIGFVSAEIIERGANWNKINNTDGTYNLKIYNNIINILNGSNYIPIDTQIKSSNYSNFVYELIGAPYKVYFRNNSNTAESVRFEKDGYFFVYEISDGVIQWREQPGFPARTDTLGGGAPSNSQDSFAVINNNVLTYPAAFYNTNVTYILSNDMLKENFILSGLPSFKDYLYLEYTGKAYFNRSLKICANNQCYIPSGTQDNFYTSGKIEFKDTNDITIFYLKEPVITDSNGTSILGLYYVHGSDAQMGFDLRINKTFLETAVYPIYIDPTIKLTGNGGGADAYVRGDKPTTNYGSDSILLVKGDSPVRNSYSIFNISSIPENQKVDNATLCLYLYQDEASQNISAHHVYADWQENTITWNNQPCGTNFDNSTNCNLTAESNLSNNGLQDNTWQCWDVKNMVGKEYKNNSKKVSIALHTINIGNADEFYSKEYTDSSLWPYLNITYSLADSIPPSFSNYVENPANNSVYASGQNYKFNVTINETNPGSVWIEFNGTNYTNGITNISNVYTFAKADLAAGNYSYKWWANDTLGNINNSGIKYYTINKASTTTTLTTTPTSSITYGTASNFSCSNSNGLETILYINGIDKSVEKSLSINRAAGTYVVSCNSTDNQNYTGSSQQASYVINKADNTLTLLSSAGWSYNYGTESIFSCFAVYGAPKLYINNTEQINPITIILAAGLHNVKCNISESQNYSSEMSQGALTVNKASSQTSLTFDKTSPQFYGTSITPSCSVISGVGTSNLTLNGNEINSGQALILGAGTWSFNCSLAESQNYTYSENVSSYIINPALTTTNVLVNPGSGINYGTESNFSCSNSVGLETILYINGQDKTSEKGLNIVRAAGTYVVNCSFAGNQNYSASSEQINYTINKAIGNIKLYLNGQENNITIDYPQQYNITAATLYGSVTIYKDGIDVIFENGLNVTPARTAHVYNITTVSSGDENHSFLSITRWLNVTLDDVVPELQIISPQEGGSYGYNTSLPLTFSVSDEHLDSCWYNLDNGVNITLVDCDNSTFDAGADGSYTLYLYANDTLGNLAVKNSSFTIAVGSPTVILNSPIGIYLNNQDVTFRYTPSDSDLQSCELWGDFDGEFKLNQTDTSLTNNTENTFALNLPDGIYKWNIRCNDSMGHFVFNGNKTFYVDTINPSVGLTQPTGTKTSRIGIPIQFSIIDASPITCWYNVKYTTGQEVLGNTTVNCSSTSFTVSTDGDYILSLYVKDFANNLNSASSSFSVDTSTPVSPPSDGGGGGGGGSIYNVSKMGKLSVSLIGNIIAHPGDNKKIPLNVKNTGRIFLNKCRLIAKGNISSWIYSTNVEGIAPGQNIDFAFDLNVPEEMTSEINKGSLEVKCEEASDVQNISVSIPKEFGLIEIKDIKQEGDILKINYTFDSSKFVGDNIDVEIWLTNENETELMRIVDKSPINKAGLIKRNVEMQLPEGLEGGVYYLYFAFSSDTNNFIKKPVVLSITGKTVLDSEKGKFWVYILFLLIIGIAIFFIWRRHAKADKPNKKNYNAFHKPNSLLRKKASITVFALVFLIFLISINRNFTGFAINNSNLINKNIFGAVVFCMLVFGMILFVLADRKEKLLNRVYSGNPILRSLLHKPVYTKDGEFLGKIDNITLRDCKIENIRIKFNFNGRKKFNKKGMLITYNVIDKIGDIVLLKDF